MRQSKLRATYNKRITDRTKQSPANKQTNGVTQILTSGVATKRNGAHHVSYKMTTSNFPIIRLVSAWILHAAVLVTPRRHCSGRRSILCNNSALIWWTLYAGIYIRYTTCVIGSRMCAFENNIQIAWNSRGRHHATPPALPQFGASTTWWVFHAGRCVWFLVYGLQIKKFITVNF